MCGVFVLYLLFLLPSPHQPTTVNRQPPTDHRQPPTTNKPPPSTNHEPPTNHHQPPTATNHHHHQPTANRQSAGGFCAAGAGLGALQGVGYARSSGSCSLILPAAAQAAHQRPSSPSVPCARARKRAARPTLEQQRHPAAAPALRLENAHTQLFLRLK